MSREFAQVRKKERRESELLCSPFFMSVACSLYTLIIFQDHHGSDTFIYFHEALDLSRKYFNASLPKFLMGTSISMLFQRIQTKLLQYMKQLIMRSDNVRAFRIPTIQANSLGMQNKYIICLII